MKRAILALLLVAASALANGGPEITTVILVRHGEKAGPSGDVPLSEAGIARANELARVLESVKIDAIYSTPYERTRKTVAPIAEKLGLKVEEVASGKTYVEDMVKIIREKHEGDTVLISGHSNTTPDVIRALGVTVPDMPDSQYDNLYIVTLVKGSARLTPLRYGDVKR
jgi:2,3-bisphosphoglycerate-dependent phosphoglycerate mutase